MKIKMLLSTIIMLTLPSFAMADYDYPLGIPEAWVSPDTESPSEPEDWETEIPGFYYVNPSDPNCVNEDGYYGTPLIPICKVPIFLYAGDVAFLHGTAYSYTTTIFVRSSANETNPAWLIGAEGNEIALHFVVSGTYLYIDNLNNIGRYSGFEIRPYQGRQTNNIIVRNSTIQGTGSANDSTAISAKGESGLAMYDIMAYNNHISYKGDWDAESQNDVHALQTGSYLTNVWYLNNHTHHNGGDGAQFSHGGKEVSHIYYGGNYSHHERENCIDIKQANDVIISSNTCHSIYKVDSANGECMVVHYDPSRIWFINNDISDCVTGIMSTGAFDVYAVGNNIHDMHEASTESHGNISSYQTGAGIAAYSTGYLYAINNTITDAVRGISYEAGSYFPTITGNIITNMKSGAYTGNEGFAILVKGTTASSNQTIFENNLFYNPSRLYLTNAIYENLTDFMEGTGKCALGGCLSEDPQYLSYPDNLRLKETSSAVDGGIVSDVYQTYEDLYGLSIEADLNYITRYNTPDMGAFESNQSVLPRFPIAAKEIYVNVNTGELSWVPLTLDASSYTIYKDGVVLTDTLSGDSSSYAISDITNGKAKYKIGTTNSKGYIVSDSITSDDISFIRTVDVSESLDTTKSWSIFRQGQYSRSGNVDISYPKYSSTPYGASFSRTSFTKEADTFNGYVYIKGEEGNYINGTVSGTGSATMYFVDSNYSDNLAASEIKVNDSKIFVDTDKGFNQTLVTLGLDGETVNNYTYEVTRGEPKSIVGISAIIEK